MRVQLGHSHERPVQIVRTDTDSILVLCKGMPVNEPLIRRLDELLREYEPRGLQIVRMHTYGEAATALDVSPQWLKTRVGKGTIPHHRLGTYVRFTPEDVDLIRDSMQRGGDTG